MSVHIYLHKKITLKGVLPIDPALIILPIYKSLFTLNAKPARITGRGLCFLEHLYRVNGAF
jgi:hypothetical protein